MDQLPPPKSWSLREWTKAWDWQHEVHKDVYQAISNFRCHTWTEWELMEYIDGRYQLLTSVIVLVLWQWLITDHKIKHGSHIDAIHWNVASLTFLSISPDKCHTNILIRATKQSFLRKMHYLITYLVSKDSFFIRIKLVMYIKNTWLFRRQLTVAFNFPNIINTLWSHLPVRPPERFCLIKWENQALFSKRQFHAFICSNDSIIQGSGWT